MAASKVTTFGFGSCRWESAPTRVSSWGWQGGLEVCPLRVFELESAPAGPDDLDFGALAPGGFHDLTAGDGGRWSVELRAGRRTRALALVLQASPETVLGDLLVRELDGRERAALQLRRMADTTTRVGEIPVAGRLRVGAHYDEALLAPTDSSYRFAFRARGSRAMLRFGYGIALDALDRGDGEPVTFRVQVEQAGAVRECFARTIAPSRNASERGPLHATVDLGSLADGAATLHLDTLAHGEARDRVALAVWSHPVLELGEMPQPGPGLILVSLDTLRADHLGCYGDPRELTPHLDALAEQSQTFTKVFSQAPFTLPSHASILSGQYPSVHGMIEQGIHRDPRVTRFVAEEARDQGYRTAAFTGGLQLSESMGIEGGFESYHVRDLIQHDRWAELESWLDHVGDAPFFLFLHTYAAHAYEPPEEILRSVHEPCASRLCGQRGLAGLRAMRQNMTDADRRHVQELYAASVRFADRQFGRAMEILRRRGLLERMPLIVTSDHGEELFDHEDFGHGRTLHREQVHVPLLLRPAGGGGALTVEGVFESIDLHPTMRRLLGLPKDGDPDLQPGVDLLDPVTRQESRAAFSELVSRGRAAMRSARWATLVQFSDSADDSTKEVFDLAADGTEQETLAADAPLFVEAGAQFDAAQQRIWDARARASPQNSSVRLDPDLVRRLRAAGYVVRLPGED